MPQHIKFGIKLFLFENIDKNKPEAWILRLLFGNSRSEQTLALKNLYVVIIDVYNRIC